MEPGAGITFELTSKQGAALITKHPTYREDIERKRRFRNYINDHYESWVEFARELDHGDNIRPILVTGVDLTREFATIAYSNNQANVKCKFSAAVPTVGSASVSVWGSWHTRGLIHTNCGPSLRVTPTTQEDSNSSQNSALQSAIPDENNQCVFIRYYTIRRRFLIPTVIKAGAGPHQLPKSDPGGDNTDEEELQSLSGDDSTDTDHPETGSRVVHNVPLVCPEFYPRLPLLTNWTKDDRDAFDVVAEFIFQVRNVFL